MGNGCLYHMSPGISMLVFFFQNKIFLQHDQIAMHAFFATTKAAIEWGCCKHAACFFLHAKYVC